MPDERTVLDHLRDGRDALIEEVTRLTAAIEQLDSVLGRIGLSSSGSAVAPSPFADASTLRVPAEQVVDEPVNPRAEVEPTMPESSRASAPRKATKAAKATTRTAEKPTVRATAKAPAKAPARKAAASGLRRQGEPPKSIRVHVLEMLAADNREFGLAEIIDRVHDAGIQAHDDAVRSITIKLMKDGRVERVGRGQYRLARRGAAARAASAATATAPRVTETAPEPPPAAVAPITEVESVPVQADEPASTAPAANHAAYEPAITEAIPAEAPVDSSDALGPDKTEDEPVPEPVPEPEPEPQFTPAPVPSSYTPPLNLGQPWSGGK